MNKLILKGFFRSNIPLRSNYTMTQVGKNRTKTDMKPAQILARVTAMVEDTQASLPQADVCKQTIRNERAQQIPREPANL